MRLLFFPFNFKVGVCLKISNININLNYLRINFTFNEPSHLSNEYDIWKRNCRVSPFYCLPFRVSSYFIDLFYFILTNTYNPGEYNFCNCILIYRNCSWQFVLFSPNHPKCRTDPNSFVRLHFREQPIFTCKAHVFHIDPKTKRSWLPASTASINVSFFYDSTRSLYRIISVEGTKVRIIAFVTSIFSATLLANIFFRQSSTAP